MIYLLPLIAVLGWFTNRIRGGGLIEPPFHIRNNTIASKGRLINDLVFAFTFSLVTLTPTAFPFLMAGMWIGRAPGWGEYIGAMVLKNKRYKNALKLSLRGIMWTAPLGAAIAVTSSLGGLGVHTDAIMLFTLSGFFMGIIYLLVIEVCDKVFKVRHAGWKYGEHIWGVILWSLVLITLMSNNHVQ